MVCRGIASESWSNVQRRFSLTCANRFLGLVCTGTCHTSSGRTRMLTKSSSKHNRGNALFQCRSTERDIQSIRFVTVNSPKQTTRILLPRVAGVPNIVVQRFPNFPRSLQRISGWELHSGMHLILLVCLFGLSTCLVNHILSGVPDLLLRLWIRSWAIYAAIRMRFYKAYLYRALISVIPWLTSMHMP